MSDHWNDKDLPTLRERQQLSKSQIAKPFITGMVIIGVCAMAAIVIVSALVPDSAGIIIQIVTLTGVLLATIATLTKINESNVRLDGRMDSALDLTARAGRSIGFKEGVQAARKEAMEVAERVVGEKLREKSLGRAEGKAEGVKEERREERNRQADDDSCG